MASEYIVVFLVGINFSVSAAYKWCKGYKNQFLKCNYFPKDIPSGIVEVQLENFTELYDYIVVDSSTFQSENWSQVKRLKLIDDLTNDTKTLKFEAKSFIGLDNLQEFHIHVQIITHLDSEALVGLNSLKTLDFARCGHLSLNDVSSAISGSANLNSLEILNISRMNYHVAALDIGKSFFIPLGKTNIKYIDIRHTDISMIRFYTLQYLQTLECLNLSSSSIGDMTLYPDKQAKNYSLFRNVKILDVSYYPLTKLALFVPSTITNFAFLSWDLRNALYIVRQFLSGHSINVTGILSSSKKIVKLKNCVVNVTSPIPWHVREIVARQNNLNRLDAEFHCGNYTAHTIKRIDIAENNLEFLHPSIFSCAPNIEMLELSNNLLYQMVKENVTLFENVFNSLRHLKAISLSVNRLQFIPRKLFANNLELISVDLSFNFLSQITFIVDRLNHLKVLDLQTNTIQILNEESMAMLDSIQIEQSQANAIVNLNNNPICCSKCEAKSFLAWLTKTNVVQISNLKCVDVDMRLVNVSNNGLLRVKNICKRRTIMIVSVASVAAVALLAILSSSIAYKRRKQQLQKRKRDTILEQLRNGKGAFKFVAYLHFSSDDDEFVQSHIENELNNTLREIVRLTGLMRELVCSERNVQPGRSLLREMDEFVESSSVIVIVLSEAYCSSYSCTRSLECMTTFRKPIVLMIKEQIRENQMDPIIKLIYEKAALKFQWEHINENYVLKTSWDQVCSSVIDLIVENNLK